MSLLNDIANPLRWPAWPPHLIGIARRRFQEEGRRKQMQRFAELDPRFAADIGLTPDEVWQGRAAGRASVKCCRIQESEHGHDHQGNRD